MKLIIAKKSIARLNASQLATLAGGAMAPQSVNVCIVGESCASQCVRITTR